MTTKEDVDSFKQHRLWQVLDEAIRAVQNSSGRSQTDRETLAKVLSVSKYVKRFRSAEVYLFPANRMGTADSISATFDTILSQVIGWDHSAAMQPATVQTLDTYSDQAMAQSLSGQWPIPIRGVSPEQLIDATDSYRQIADESLESISNDLQNARSQLAIIQARADELALQSEARAAEAATAVDALQEALAAQALNAQESLQIELKRVVDSAKVQHEALQSDANELLDGLRANNDLGNDLVKQVADQSVGGGYLEFATTEIRAYKSWNFLGFASGIAAFAYLAIVFWVDKPTIEGSILKVGISLSLVALSAYAFREAGKHQRQSLEARYRALDVLALPPFSKDLSETQRRELRFMMGERLFGKSVAEVTMDRKSNEKSTSLNFSVDAASIKAALDSAKLAREIAAGS